MSLGGKKEKKQEKANMQIWKTTLDMSLEGFVKEVQGMYGQKDETRISAWSPQQHQMARNGARH